MDLWIEWRLDMPNLTNVVLPYDVFKYKDDVTIIGSTLFLTLLLIDIGALQRYFNESQGIEY